MAVRPVRQSASKEHFLQSLNLDLGLNKDRETFVTMWEEATQYWVRTFETEDRSFLKPEYAINPGVRKPYKWGHLDRTAIDTAIDEISRHASERSYPYYQLGQSADQNIHNWVLKWLLWHVARYRDERNNSKKGRKKDGSSTSSSPGREVYRLAIRERDMENGDYPNHGFPASESSQGRTYWHTVMGGKP